MKVDKKIVLDLDGGTSSFVARLSGLDKTKSVDRHVIVGSRIGRHSSDCLNSPKYLEVFQSLEFIAE